MADDLEHLFDGFDIFIDPGDAGVAEVRELLEALSNLNVTLGGQGLLFDSDGLQSRIGVAVAK